MALTSTAVEVLLRSYGNCICELVIKTTVEIPKSVNNAISRVILCFKLNTKFSILSVQTEVGIRKQGKLRLRSLFVPLNVLAK